MEVGTSIFKRRLVSDFQLFSLTNFVWILANHIIHPANLIPSTIEISFGIVVSLLTVVLLRLFGYFPAPRLLPRPSDFFSVLLTFPLSSAITLEIFNHLFSFNLFNEKAMIISSCFLSVTVFTGHSLLSWASLKIYGKRKIVLDVSEKEKLRFLRDLRTTELVDWVEFFSIG